MWPFKQKTKIQIGQVWGAAKNPFRTLDFTIVDIQKGYVKYKFGRNCFGNATIGNFTWSYDLIKDVPDAD